MISVIIPCYDSERTLAECLDSLTRQTLSDFEVILVDSSPDPAPAERVVARYPSFRYLHVDERLLPHAGRNRGVELARGSIFTFSDPDCRVEPNWLECIAAAHRAGQDAVGGSVAGIAGWRNQAIHMVKYGWWLPNGRRGAVPQLVSANLSVTRALWDRIGPFAAERWSGDTEFSWRIQASGVPLLFEPSAQITHLDHGGFRAFFRERWLRGYDFGSMRAETEQWSRVHCFARILATPLVPFVMLWRTAGRAMTARCAGTWLLTAPAQAIAQACWAFGEAAGTGAEFDDGPPVTEPSPAVRVTHCRHGSPTVSVVIPAHGEATRIEGAVRCVLDQVGAPPFEVIVVDSSSDGTADVVRETYPTVQLIEHDRRLSAGAARNRGFGAARGEKILCTDADVRVPRDWIARMCAHLDEVDLVGGSIGNGTPRSLSGTVLYLLEFFRLLPDGGVPARDDARFIATANAGYRREAIEGLRFLDVSTAEDIVLHHEIVRAGARSRFDPSLSVTHLNKTGWGRVVRHQLSLGEGGYRWRRHAAPTRPLSVRVPVVMVIKPVLVVGYLLLTAIRRGRWRQALWFGLLSPLLVAVDAFWVVGYLRAAYRRRPDDEDQARQNARTDP